MWNFWKCYQEHRYTYEEPRNTHQPDLLTFVKVTAAKTNRLGRKPDFNRKIEWRSVMLQCTFSAKGTFKYYSIGVEMHSLTNNYGYKLFCASQFIIQINADAQSVSSQIKRQVRGSRCAKVVRYQVNISLPLWTLALYIYLSLRRVTLALCFLIVCTSMPLCI